MKMLKSKQVRNCKSGIRVTAERTGTGIDYNEAKTVKEK